MSAIDHVADGHVAGYLEALGRLRRIFVATFTFSVSLRIFHVHSSFIDIQERSHHGSPDRCVFLSRVAAVARLSSHPAPDHLYTTFIVHVS